MIHFSRIADVARLQSDISLKWVAEDGTVIDVDHAVITSFHGNGSTFNIKILSSGEIRKVNRLTVIEFNGEEVTL